MYKARAAEVNNISRNIYCYFMDIICSSNKTNPNKIKEPREIVLIFLSGQFKKRESFFPLFLVLLYFPCRKLFVYLHFIHNFIDEITIMLTNPKQKSNVTKKQKHILKFF